MNSGRLQVNIYGWALRKEGYDVRRGRLVYIFRDWKKNETFKSADYPSHPIDIQTFGLADEAEMDEWILARVKAFQEVSTAPLESLSVCSPADRWQKAAKWAVKKSGNQKAMKLFDDKDAAIKFMESWAADQVPAHSVEQGEDGGFQIMKAGRKTPVKKGFRVIGDAQKEADTLVKRLTGENLDKLELEHRPGEDTRCVQFCNVAQWCPHGSKLMEGTNNGE